MPDKIVRPDSAVYSVRSHEEFAIQFEIRGVIAVAAAF
jgi:hypothetical protein